MLVLTTLACVLQSGRLLDMYARSDITALAKGNSYSRLQWEEVTVGQALALAQQTGHPSQTSSSQVGKAPLLSHNETFFLSGV